nr:superinfection immunity protein [uncultured Sphingomonas sp.]
MSAAFILAALIGMTIYLLPTIIAFARGHEQRVAIAFANGLAGWTAFVWFGLLIWSAWIRCPLKSFAHG